MNVSTASTYQTPAGPGFRFETSAGPQVDVVLTDSQGRPIRRFAVRPSFTVPITAGGARKLDLRA